MIRFSGATAVVRVALLTCLLLVAGCGPTREEQYVTASQILKIEEEKLAALLDRQKELGIELDRAMVMHLHNIEKSSTEQKAKESDAIVDLDARVKEADRMVAEQKRVVDAALARVAKLQPR